MVRPDQAAAVSDTVLVTDPALRDDLREEAEDVEYCLGHHKVCHKGLAPHLSDAKRDRSHQQKRNEHCQYVCHYRYRAVKEQGMAKRKSLPIRTTAGTKG